MNEANTGRRLVVIGAIVLALFAGLLTRLWFLQVSGGEKLAVAAQQNRDRVVQVPALRGAIYDRNGVVLARNVPVTTLTLDRQNLTAADRVTLEDSLSTLLNKSPVEIGVMIDDPKVSPYAPLPLLENVPSVISTYVAEHREMFPGVTITTSSVRQYTPEGIAAANLLGYTGLVSPEELKAHKADGYATDDEIGKTGIEQVFESQLRGTPGIDKVQVDSLGRATNVITEKQPEPGRDVQLTLDAGVQKIAAESLQQGMDGARSLVDPDSGDYYKATGGAVVVLDARTGSIVAMASGPSYDPNAFINHTADPFINDPNHPLLDRATSGYAPGSTFKTISAIAMLDTGIRSPSDTVYDEGCFKFGNDEQRCNAGKHSYGTVDLQRALTVSSDVYFYNVGNAFWTNYRDEGQAAGFTGDLAGDQLPASGHAIGYGIQNTARDFGLGSVTGFGQGESPGRIPDLAFNKELNKANCGDTACTWRRGDSANLAVGQGDVLVTPLQLALAYGAFGNGGTLYSPRVASAVLSSAAELPAGQLGAVDHTIDRQVKHAVNMPQATHDAVLAGLDGVVQSSEGTAYGAFQGYAGPFHVIGKTGTAQVTNGQDTSWFVSILNPENDPAQPQYVVLAMVEQGGFGASVAAPIVRRVIDYLSNPAVAPAPVNVAPATGNEQSN